MSNKPSKPETKPEAKPTEPTPELPLIRWVSLVQVPGGWVVATRISQGDKFVKPTVFHNGSPQRKEYATITLKTVIASKFLAPNVMINLEEDDD